MNEKLKISSRQIKGLIVTTVIGVGVLSLPGDLANILGLDGWIPIILAGLVVGILVILMVKTLDFYPQMNFFEISRQVLGPIFNFLYQIMFLIYLMTLLAYVSRGLGEVVKAFLLVTTPIEVIIFTFILATTYISRCEIDVIGRMGYFIYPIIVGFTLFLILVTMPTIDITNMVPVLQSDIKLLPKGLLTGFVSFAGFEILLFSIPYVENRKKVLKSSLSAIGLVILVYLVVYFLAISQFGVIQLKRLPWATLSLVKDVDLPGLFLENLDGLIMAVWVIVVFGTLAPFLFMSSKILNNLFKTKSHELYVLPTIPIIYTLALLPQNPVQVTKDLAGFLNIMGVIVVLIMPIIIYILAYIKNRRTNN